MKRLRMSKAGQITFNEDGEVGDQRFSVHPLFLVPIAFLIILVVVWTSL